MKILSIGYYDDFARFFLSIKKELLKINPNVEFKYLSVYFSGFLYFAARFNKVSFFPLKATLNAKLKRKSYLRSLRNNNHIYEGVNLDEVISYHFLLDTSKEIELKIQAMSYIDICKSYLDKNKPSLILLSGDSRMCVQIMDKLAMILSIPCFYFEQGPFNTTIFDTVGVNANYSFRTRKISSDFSKNLKELKNEVFDFLQREKGIKYKRNPLYRGSDYLLEIVLNLFGIYPIDTKIEKKRKNDIISNDLSIPILKNKLTYLLILQVPYDANMIYHSPFFNNHFDIVKDVFSNLPDDSQLIVREHPLYKGAYEKELYDYIRVNDIILDNNDLNTSISLTNVVVVNNSTVGIEALFRLKPLVVLGNSYYDNELVCFKLKEKNQIKKLLKEASVFKKSDEIIFSFLKNLKDDLIDGHFRNDNLNKLSKEIVNKILK